MNTDFQEMGGGHDTEIWYRSWSSGLSESDISDIETFAEAVAFVSSEHKNGLDLVLDVGCGKG
jgi:hypothetical protein